MFKLCVLGVPNHLINIHKKGARHLNKQCNLISNRICDVTIGVLHCTVLGVRALLSVRACVVPLVERVYRCLCIQVEVKYQAKL